MRYLQLIVALLIGLEVLFVIPATSVVLAQNSTAKAFQPTFPPANFTKNYVGNINNIKIQMTLTGHGKELSGSYFYEKYKKNIPLKGRLTDQGYFQIEEYADKEYPTGSFIGAFVSSEAFTGYWQNGAPATKHLPFQLIEAGKDPNTVFSDTNKPRTLECNVPNDKGAATFFMIGETIIGFNYQNVGANSHICDVDTNRAEENIIWQDGPATTITFTKDYSGDDESGNVVIEKGTDRYTITFNGSFRYFCGARAGVPTKVLISKSAQGWVGKAQY
ncbi:MAG: hypothetical protein AB1489_42805 [Acidobacteriota bacterium]